MKNFVFLTMLTLLVSCDHINCYNIKDLTRGDNGLYYTKKDMELADGNVCSLGGAELKDGKPHGTWKAWYNKDESKNWYEQGDKQLMRIHTYDEGKRHGTFKMWNESGKLIAEAVFKKDKCISGDCDYPWTEWLER